MIGIIGAMEEEVADLKSAMDIEQTVTKAKMTFVKGKLCGKDVVVVRSGVGKVNAGVCAQILIDVFDVDTLINTGIAGSLDAQIDIGDIVISTDAVQHDIDASSMGTPVGHVPLMGMFSFPADKKLIEAACLANEEENTEIRTFTGRIVTGDQFISDDEKKNYLVNTFDGKCAEMEGAAIAHTAYLNDVPYVIIRAISDKADNSATMDYPTFEKHAAKCSVKLLKNMLDRL